MKTYEGIGRLASRLLTATVGSGCANCAVDFTRPQSSSILSPSAAAYAMRSGVHRKCTKTHINDKSKKREKSSFYRPNPFALIRRDLFTICVVDEEKRDPRRTRSDSHVKSRVRERLIIYRSSDPFNRRGLKFIEGYLRDGKI